MPKAELRWPPFPYRAGFCITDDTDTATLDSVRAVYDTLHEHGVFATKTVWAFPPEEPCGVPGLPPSIQRGVTLADRGYRDYCASLAQRGFELTLHGATAGNNTRERTLRGFAALDEIAPRSPVFICHAKNAENPYWQQHVVARGPLRSILNGYAGQHRCSGEVPASPYFWGDVCLDRVRYIRLLRTRRIDTLAANPSMPYFEREKPFVRGWFSATKRSFRDVTADAALTALESAWGVCVLYQYMCRYADPATGRATAAFTAGVQRLAQHARVWKANTGAILNRLRLIQGVQLASQGRELWLFNTSAEDAPGLQIETDGEWADAPPEGCTLSDGILHVPLLPAGECRRFVFRSGVVACGRGAMRLSLEGHAQTDFGHGRLAVNVSDSDWTVSPGMTVGAARSLVKWSAGLESVQPRSRATDRELTRLFLEQSAIIVGEVLFRGRALDSNRWLGTDTIQLESHDNW